MIPEPVHCSLKETPAGRREIHDDPVDRAPRSPGI
jgi:hypothetical protein